VRPGLGPAGCAVRRGPKVAAGRLPPLPHGKPGAKLEHCELDIRGWMPGTVVMGSGWVLAWSSIVPTA
jgi:hypothetical protein